MKASPVFILFLQLAFSGYSQIDYEDIRTKIKNPESEYYYPSLLERFKNSDTSFTALHFDAFYYGSIFLESYDTEEISSAEEKIREANFSRDFKRAYELADSLLKIYPVSLQAYFEKAFACHNLNLTEEEAYNQKRYKVLIRVVKTSGDGQSFATAWHANLPNDEFEVLKYLGLEIKDETEIEYDSQVFDVFGLKANKLKMKQAVFNVSWQVR